MDFSERIQELRKENRDSQEQLAEKLGVSRQAVSKWESGQGIPDVNNIMKISEVYSVSTDYILKGIALIPQTETPKKMMDAGLKKALLIILVIGGIALVAFFFILLLGTVIPNLVRQ